MSIITVLNETFTAANGTELGTLTNWDKHISSGTRTQQVDNNRIHTTATGTGFAIYENTIDVNNNDYTVTSTFFHRTDNGNQELLVKLSQADLSGYGISYNSSAELELERWVAGSGTTLGTWVNAYPDDTSFEITVVLLADSIKVYADDILRIDVVDSTYENDAGNIGVRGNFSNSSTIGTHIDSILVEYEAPTYDEGTYGGTGGTYGNLDPDIATISATPALLEFEGAEG